MRFLGGLEAEKGIKCGVFRGSFQDMVVTGPEYKSLGLRGVKGGCVFGLKGEEKTECRSCVNI